MADTTVFESEVLQAGIVPTLIPLASLEQYGMCYIYLLSLFPLFFPPGLTSSSDLMVIPSILLLVPLDQTEKEAGDCYWKLHKVKFDHQHSLSVDFFSYWEN